MSELIKIFALLELIVIILLLVVVLSKPVIEIEKQITVEKNCADHYQKNYEEIREIENIIKNNKKGDR